MKKHYSAMVVAGVIGFTVPFCSQAADLLKADLKPCLHDGTSMGGVNSCGKIWKLKAGKAKLGADGTLDVQVSGLVLNDESTGKYNGTPDGVDAVAAAVICDGSVAGQTEAMPLSKGGDAKIKAKLQVPAGCANPMVVLRERYEGKIGGWLAGTGK
jgi:hypothetical protein